MRDIVGEATLSAMSEARYYNSWILDLIKPYLKEPVAEIGAGIGTFSKKISMLGYRVSAIDYNAAYLEKISKESPNIEVFPLDIQAPSLPRAMCQKFETAISLNMLEHVPDHTRAVGNINQLLVKGGKVIILVPAFQLFYNRLDKELGHVRRYSIDNLTQLLVKNRFVINKLRFINPLGLIGWWIAGKIFNQKVINNYQIRIFDFISRPLLYLEKHLPMPFGISLICVAEKI